MRWSNIFEHFSHERLAHCKVCVTQSDVEPKAATAAAAALTTKITVTGKAGITFYWADDARLTMVEPHLGPHLVVPHLVTGKAEQISPFIGLI